ncbi:hypothetical protein B0T14DRAFT_559036 [Immersiella caudata]|uniref:AAA+ ATPase domain-containing protein n=1 Tax=Immersiella caudata TaxID=314043 RepID=A0AA39XDK6_9PEZI|nr:hypothetical protein B0T14DRAFT_559036 [Immersiella caudata]
MSLKWSTRRAPDGQSEPGDRDEEETFEWPSNMRDVVGALMGRIDKLQGVVSVLREKNAEFEVRLQTEGQLRRDMEMWWGTKRPEPDKRLHQARRTTGKAQPPSNYQHYYGVDNPDRLLTLGAKKSEGPPPPARTDASESSEYETDAPPMFKTAGYTAKLNRVDWDKFDTVAGQRGYRQGERGLFVVDVLVGDPPLALGLPVRPHTPTPPAIEDSTPSEATPDTIAASSSPAESNPLPERIRINSGYVAPFILSFSFPNAPSPKQESVLMIPPFKALTYLGDRIRQEYHRLSEILGKETKCKGAVHSDMVPTAKAEAIATSTDSTSTDRDNGSKGHAVLEDPSALPPTSGFDEDDKSDSYECEHNSEATRMAHFGCLLEFIDEDLKRRTDFIRGGSCERITYAELWLLFQPGDVVVWKDTRQACLVLGTVDPGHKVTQRFHGGALKSAAGEAPDGFEVIHVVIGFDGQTLGPVTGRTKFLPFDGEKPITSLYFYPLAYSSIPNTREALISRGKKFPDMTRIRHMHYTGPTRNGSSVDYADSQVVVDFEECYRHNPQWRPDIQSLVGAQVESIGVDPSKVNPSQPRPCAGSCCKNETIFREDRIDRYRNSEFMNSHIPAHRSQRPSLFIYPRSLDELEASGTEISDLEYLIMSEGVYGFVLRSRKWAYLYMDKLSPSTRLDDSAEREEGSPKATERRENAFDQLVLPPGHKDMVKSLITQHFRDKESGETESADIVRGKGKGLIILLHGAPGVGKTSTAECVASYFDKPLFQITCGDLGVFAGDVESALEKHFALASRWGCILLLDEADVFLSARSPTDHLRNSLVSVFLRVLEYYVGCLFLTTNRVGDFDEAFASRIHMSLYYPPLSLESTQRVFGLNLNRIEKRLQSKDVKLDVDRVAIGGFTASYWHEYPRARWNGRQIRNACQTALALAEFESTKADDASLNAQTSLVSLEVKHFQKVADAYLGFIEYLRDIYGVHADERAKENFLRASIKDPATMSKSSSGVNPLVARRSEHHFAQGSSWNEPPTPPQNFRQQGHYTSGYPSSSSFGNPAQSYGPPHGHDLGGGPGYGGPSHYHGPPHESQQQRRNPGAGPYASPYQGHSDVNRQQQAGPDAMYPLENPGIQQQRGHGPPPQDRTGRWPSGLAGNVGTDIGEGRAEQQGAGRGDKSNTFE